MSSAATSPWKPCDLRGVFPSAVSEELFESVGKAIGSEIPEGSSVVAGGDFRLSTPALKSALIRGLTSTGLHVIDAGSAPTPIVYFYANRANANAVFIVTASHNPSAHNGLKWMAGDLPPSPEDIARIRSKAFLGGFRCGRGSVELADPVPGYKRWITTRWQHLSGKSARAIVLDPGNGAWSNLASDVFRTLGFDIACLHDTADGSFPNRSPDCARRGNLAALEAAVRDPQASLGIAWDGDGDRVAFVDADGSHVSTDEISILLAREALRTSARGEPVVCDIKLSDSVRREVDRAGGYPMLERSGHAFMRTRLLTNQAILGLDACGHYFFREAGSRDDGLYSALFVLGMLQGRSLHDLRNTVDPIFSTPELRLPSATLTFDHVRDRLRSTFPGAEELNVDGTRLMLPDGVVLARESSTEAMVSLRIEGFSHASYQMLVKRTLAVLPEGMAVLRYQIA